MLKWILTAVAAVVVIFLIVVALQPVRLSVERSATMRAPAPAAFAQVNDFQNWRAWSPWEKVDPALKRQYEGPKAGTGAVYAWQGNKDVGEGRMTITESRPAELVRIRLEFFKPFAATNTAEFSFKPAGRQHRGDLDHDRPEQLPVEGDLPVREHGQDGRRHVRAGPHPDENRSRKQVVNARQRRPK